MTVKDNRLQRDLEEQVAVSTTYTEDELNQFSGGGDDRDHMMLEDQIPRITSQLRSDPNTRRAIALTSDPLCCIVGAHVLVRDRIHVMAWFRASDIDEYREGDIAFLRDFGDEVRDHLDLEPKRISVHAFTSSLHREADLPEGE